MNIQKELNLFIPNQAKIRKQDFPLLDKQGRVYLDSTATSQSPVEVIRQMYEFRIDNIRGSNHSENSNEAIFYNNQVNDAREKINNFFHASDYYTVFTKNTTEASNILALRFDFKPEDTLVITDMEHNSEIVTSRHMAKEAGAKVTYIPIDGDGNLQIDNLEKIINETKGKVLINLIHVSNFTGLINPVEKIKEITKKYGDKVSIYLDMAQSCGHLPIDLDKMDVDFAAVSAHKMYGPMGMGALFIKKDKQHLLKDYIAGGGAVRMVTHNETVLAKLPERFEPGTQDLEGIIEWGLTVDYLNKIGIENIHQYDQALSKYFLENLKDIPRVYTYGPKDYSNRTSIVPFNIGDTKNYGEIAKKLNYEGISVRDGCFCAHIYVSNTLGTKPEEFEQIARELKKTDDHAHNPGTVRASFAFYNNLKDANRALNAIENIALCDSTGN